MYTSKWIHIMALNPKKNICGFTSYAIPCVIVPFLSQQFFTFFFLLLFTFFIIIIIIIILHSRVEIEGYFIY